MSQGTNEPARLLIVEDEAIIAMDLRQRLEGFGYEVVGIAASSDQALRLCYEAHPDLVMMDIVIRGDTDGIETAALIRGRYDIPVIYLTAYSDNSTLQRARETAPYGYLVKPFRPEDARATIEVALFKHRMERQLRQSERWFAKTLHCVSDGVIATHETGLIRFINPVAEAILGCSEREVAGKPLAEVWRLLDERTHVPIADPIRAALADRIAATRNEAGLVVAADGRETVIEYGAAPIIDEDHQVLGAVLVLRDIGHRREVERALAESEERFHSAFDFAAIGMALVALDGRFLQLNNAMGQILKRSASLARGLRVQALCHPEDHDLLDNLLQELITAEVPSTHTEIRFVGPDSEVTWSLMSLSLVSEPTGTPLYFIVQIQDITARRSAEAQLVYLAQFDHLTGLFNRAHFIHMLDQALALSRRQGFLVAVMFVDLDNFKGVNDTLGHAAGDALLKQIARRLRDSVRDSDLVGRVGGDEFVMALTGIDQAVTAQRIADTVIDNVRQEAIIGGQDLAVTISVGISLFPSDGTSSERLIVAADHAMYRAKEMGKNCSAFFSQEWGDQVNSRILSETRLRRALVDRQFELFYQPIYSTAGELRSLEALVRWRDPRRGLVPPDEFIPTAERTGLIVPLGGWVLRTACSQLMTWRRQGGRAVDLAVNLSARQFRDPKLVHMVAAILEETGIEPGHLELELTESAIMQQPERARAILRDLRTMGIEISVDDFGTGYSSLSYLKRFPIQRLKIDRSFIVDLPGDREDRAIVEAIITLSRALDLQVVAEGVETQGQLELVRELGCDLVQGYFLHRPEPVERLAPLLGINP